MEYRLERLKAKMDARLADPFESQEWKDKILKNKERHARRNPYRPRISTYGSVYPVTVQQVLDAQQAQIRAYQQLIYRNRSNKDFDIETFKDQLKLLDQAYDDNIQYISTPQQIKWLNDKAKESSRLASRRWYRDNKEHRKEYMKEYNSRPEVKERNADRARERYERKRKALGKKPGPSKREKLMEEERIRLDAEMREEEFENL